MIQKKGVLVFLVFLLINCVLAADDNLIIKQDAIKDKVLIGDQFIFSLGVQNPSNETDSFRFYSPLTFFEWIFRMDPSTLIIKGDQSKEVKLYIEPYDWDEVEPGNYAITLNLVSNNHSDINEELVFNVEILAYDQVVNSELVLPKKIDSAEQNLFRVKLKNNYDFSVENLTLELKSDYFDEYIQNINIDEHERVEEFVVDFGDKIKTGENDIHVILYHKGKVVIDRVEKINIDASGDVSEIGSPERGFLYYKETIEKINNKNAVSYESFTKRVSLFQKMFVTVSEEPTTITKETGNYIYQWDFSLEPGAGKVVVIETDYRAFFYGLLIVIILAWIIYLYLKKDLELTKKITNVQHSGDNISTIGVMLLLKNKSLKRVKNVKLMDGMSNVIEVPTKFGSVQPSRVIKLEKGSKMMWDFPVIEAGAEIVISYQVKVRAKVIGKIMIPSAIAKYMKAGRRMLVRSNKVRMFS